MADETGLPEYIDTHEGREIGRLVNGLSASMRHTLLVVVRQLIARQSRRQVEQQCVEPLKRPKLPS